MAESDSSVVLEFAVPAMRRARFSSVRSEARRGVHRSKPSKLERTVSWNFSWPYARFVAAVLQEHADARALCSLATFAALVQFCYHAEVLSDQGQSSTTR